MVAFRRRHVIVIIASGPHWRGVEAANQDTGDRGRPFFPGLSACLHSPKPTFQSNSEPKTTKRKSHLQLLCHTVKQEFRFWTHKESHSTRNWETPAKQTGNAFLFGMSVRHETYARNDVMNTRRCCKKGRLCTQQNNQSFLNIIQQLLLFGKTSSAVSFTFARYL